MAKVLVIGTGGREHAICWKFSQSPLVEEVFVANGNGGMDDVATVVNIKPLEFDKLIAFAKEEGLLLQTASYMFPPVRACENGECTIERMTPEESGRVRWEYDVFRYETESLKNRVRMIMEGKELHDEDNECQELPTERIRCRAGATTFWVTYKGEMRPCGMMQVPSVNLLDMGFENAWEAIRRERERIMIPAKCTACKWNKVCEHCPATCYAENGTFEQAPDYICEKTKAYLKCALDWYSKQM